MTCANAANSEVRGSLLCILVKVLTGGQKVKANICDAGPIGRDRLSATVRARPSRLPSIAAVAEKAYLRRKVASDRS